MFSRRSFYYPIPQDVAFGKIVASVLIPLWKISSERQPMKIYFPAILCQTLLRELCREY